MDINPHRNAHSTTLSHCPTLFRMTAKRQVISAGDIVEKFCFPLAHHVGHYGRQYEISQEIINSTIK
jgi:hypothetical protein